MGYEENVYESSITIRIFELRKILIKLTKIRKRGKQKTWERSEDK